MVKKSKKYTVSSYVWTNLSDVEAQLVQWEKEGTLNPNTIVFEIKREVERKKKLYNNYDCSGW